MNATIGGLIKDFRIQKGISQLDIAFSLGWKETSRLSRIEQGKTEKPSRELLDKLLTAMKLDPEEKNYILLVGDYLPDEQEIKNAQQNADNLIKNWPYPAILFDFSWRIVKQNEMTEKVYNFDKAVGDSIEKNHPRILDVLFKYDYKEYQKIPTPELTKIKLFLESAIIQFKHDQATRTKEKWYIEHIKDLLSNELFKELWIKSQNIDKNGHLIGKFIEKFLPNPKDPAHNLNFYVFITPLLYDQRFEVEFHVPKDSYTMNFFNNT